MTKTQVYEFIAGFAAGCSTMPLVQAGVSGTVLEELEAERRIYIHRASTPVGGPYDQTGMIPLPSGIYPACRVSKRQ